MNELKNEFTIHLEEDTRLQFWTWLENHPQKNIAKLAERIGVSHTTMRRYIIHKHKPTMHTLMMINKFVRDENRKIVIDQDQQEAAIKKFFEKEKNIDAQETINVILGKTLDAYMEG